MYQENKKNYNVDNSLQQICHQSLYQHSVKRRSPKHPQICIKCVNSCVEENGIAPV